MQCAEYNALIFKLIRCNNMMKKTLFGCCILLCSSFVSAKTLEESIILIEQNIAGRVGVSVFDTQNNQHWNYKGNERFPMMSTFKTLACAKMLQELDGGDIKANTQYLIKKEDLVVYSPITKKQVGNTITPEKSCEATMLTSDNTAANIVLQHIGGPKGVTDFLRSIGDNVTRLDRFEPDLNEAKINDLRDTTTPNAMVQTLNTILLGEVLTENAQSQLTTWMKNNTISGQLLRSVLPQDWIIADRTGAGAHGSRGITALVWNTKRKPIIISIYLTQTDLSFAERNRVISEIGEIIFKAYLIF